MAIGFIWTASKFCFSYTIKGILHSYITFRILWVCPGRIIIFLRSSPCKEALNPIINFSESFITASKLDWVSIDFEKAIFVDNFAIVYLVSVVSFGEDVLNAGTGIDKSSSHSRVF